MAHVWNVLDGNIYVSKNGNDTTGDGTMANPYASINKATTVGADGNKIVIGTGVWQEARGSSTNKYFFEGDGEVIFDYSAGSYFIPYISYLIKSDYFTKIKFKNTKDYAGFFRVGGQISPADKSLLPNCFFCEFDELTNYSFNVSLLAILKNCAVSKLGTFTSNGRMNLSIYLENCTVKEFRYSESASAQLKNFGIINSVLEYASYYTYQNNFGGPVGNNNLIKTDNILWVGGITMFPEQSGNIKGLDPQFNNPLVGDYTLQPTSPCLFAGKNNSTIGAFGLGYSFNANSSAFTKEAGATFSASSGTDDIVRASQTINGLNTYLFNLNAGKLSGTVESAWIDLQAIRYLLTTRLFANIIYGASGVATSRPDNLETAAEKAVYYDFEFKYCLTEAEKAAATWKAVIWNKAVTIDNSNRGNADAAFVASEAKYISARFVKIKLYMKET